VQLTQYGQLQPSLPDGPRTSAPLYIAVVSSGIAVQAFLH